MKRNERGITLIALVVTIIVLLILAGTSIAMLSGDNGILTNAQKSQVANKEAEVMEMMSTAYNTAKTEVMVKTATTTDYKPTAKKANLAAMVAKEVGITPTGSEGTTLPTVKSDKGYLVSIDGNKIIITYEDNKFSVAPGTAPGKNQYNKIVATITLTDTDISYTAPTSQVN